MNRDEEFEALRRRARAMDLDVYFAIGKRISRGETTTTTWPDGEVTTGIKFGPDSPTLGESLAIVDTLLTSEELEGAA